MPCFPTYLSDYNVVLKGDIHEDTRPSFHDSVHHCSNIGLLSWY